MTEEVPQDIFDNLDHAPSAQLFDFLEQELGCETMARFSRDVEAA